MPAALPVVQSLAAGGTEPPTVERASYLPVEFANNGIYTILAVVGDHSDTVHPRFETARLAA